MKILYIPTTGSETDGTREDRAVYAWNKNNRVQRNDYKYIKKTVSAFSNYDGGEIFFGIDDGGNIKGLSDVKQACLDIENKINNSITPQPYYTLELIMRRVFWRMKIIFRELI